MDEKIPKQLPAETSGGNKAINPEVLPPEETPDQLLEKGGDFKVNIRDAFYDVLKMVPGVERETLNKNLVGMLEFVSEEVKETEREIERMQTKGTDKITILNWQEGLRQKKCALIYYKLSLEALEDIETSGKGAE
ncbi:MAG: hypothetical protein Q7S12_02485 [bacterium]|nr:hypothetical protein [bacterium]